MRALRTIRYLKLIDVADGDLSWLDTARWPGQPLK